MKISRFRLDARVLQWGYILWCSLLNSERKVTHLREKRGTFFQFLIKFLWKVIFWAVLGWNYPPNPSTESWLCPVQIYKCLRVRTERLIMWLHSGTSSLLLFGYVYGFRHLYVSKVSVPERVFLTSAASASAYYHRGRSLLGDPASAVLKRRRCDDAAVEDTKYCRDEVRRRRSRVLKRKLPFGNNKTSFGIVSSSTFMPNGKSLLHEIPAS